MANEIPKMSLKQATPIQGSFTPVVYTPQTEDLSLLQKSLAQIEARQTSAYEQQAKFNETAAKLQTLVNPEEKQWVYDYINKQSSGFKNSIESGDYGSALRQAVNAGSNLLSTPEAIGRIKAQEEYQQEVKAQQVRRDKGEISQNTYDWWMSNNPYKYEDTYDNNGNIIGGSSFVAESRPVADINWAAQAQAAFKMITPYKNKKSSETSTSTSSTTDGNGSSSSKSSGSSRQVEKVSKKDILDNIEALLSATPDGFRQAEQAFDVAIFEFNKMSQQYQELIAKNPDSKEAKILKQKLNAREKLMYKNGSPIDYKEYYARMITNNLYADKLAYEWHTNATSSSTSRSSQKTTPKPESTGTTGTTGTTGIYTQTPGSIYNSSTDLVDGPNVRNEIYINDAQQGVESAVYNINGKPWR
uniref:Uncharacterized protein n=1 Tax=Geladintestivirus 6 TaxID=3233138 RepID=A0AAU8MJW7_9CAUD